MSARPARRTRRSVVVDPPVALVALVHVLQQGLPTTLAVPDGERAPQSESEERAVPDGERALQSESGERARNASCIFTIEVSPGYHEYL